MAEVVRPTYQFQITPGTGRSRRHVRSRPNDELLPLELSGRLDRNQRRRALELLDSVGLADRTGSFPDVLSGGEQQRVAIARALAHDPLLLIAGEPTGNLDLETAHEIIALLEHAVRDGAKTLVVATHSREVAALGDRVLAIEGGRFVERY